MFGTGVFGSGVFGGGVVTTAAITIGSHMFLIEGGLGDLEDPVLVLDGLDVGWAVSESTPWPAQPDPVTARLGLWTHDVAELEDVEIGDAMAITLFDSDGYLIATFHGRVSSCVARTGDGPGGLAVWYTVTGADYTVDLAELPITITEAWPAEDAADRLDRIAAAITAAGGPPVDLPTDVGTAAFDEQSAGATNGWALLADHLAQIAVADDVGRPQRYIVVPVVDEDGASVLRFACAALDNVVDASLLPATLDVVDGLLTIVFPDLDANGVVRAGDVLLDTSWTKLKFRAVNDVTVTGPVIGHASSDGATPVRLSMPTTLTDQDAADLMATLYLPDVGETNGWVSEGFKVLGHVHPLTLVPPWFPDHRADPPDNYVYAMPLVIKGIPPAINLGGASDMYSGQLVSVKLVLSDTKPNVEASLRRQLPTSTGPDAATWEWVLDTFPAITWADIDPAISWYDARLAKGS